MRAREQRRKVVINSRMRCGAVWRDARILNISPRGLGLHAPAPPVQGTYVELRRGPYVIIARVVWVNGSRFGVRTQDAIPIDSVINHSDSASGSSAERTASAPPIERRSTTRSRERQHEASRTVGKAMEFAFVAGLGASAAFIAFGMVKQGIGGPLAAVQMALVK